MEIDILTLFPEMFAGPFSCSVIKRALDKGLFQIRLHDIRDFALDKHRSVDDTPYGGGSGMVMKPEPVYFALQVVKKIANSPARVILLTPQGERLNQKIAQKLSVLPRLILICGHYEGFDERIREHMADQEISVGDYILTGGELPAMVLVDAVARLIPGVLGNTESAYAESFFDGLLEYPQYTKPSVFQGWPVPDILLQGDHGKIARWRREQALIRTLRRRPDLLENINLAPNERKKLEEIKNKDAEVEE
ncbi:MAG: tRNA (guanosine(37)-N1)-methyltransferase TrmD [Bacillota bacterium]